MARRIAASGARATVSAIFYCTDKRSLYCSGSWGHPDRPWEPGGRCNACRRLAANTGRDAMPEAVELPPPLIAVIAQQLLLGLYGALRGFGRQLFRRERSSVRERSVLAARVQPLGAPIRRDPRRS